MPNILPFISIGANGGWDRNGITRINVPVYVANLADVINLNTGAIAKQLGISFPCIGAPFQQTEDGNYMVTCQFEGPGSSIGSDDNITFELDTTMSEDPIESHPNFAAIADKYGWNATEKAFQINMPGTQKTTVALKNGTSLDKATNPLYGVQSFLAFGCVFRKTYASKTIPSNIFESVGSIVSAPPSIGQFALPTAPTKRNWLKMSPKLRRRGSVVEVTEEWMLSGPGGWNADVYAKGQLEGT